MSTYEEFLKTKALESQSYGIAKPGRISKQLFPFQRDIVKWALKRGRAAIFADCGLGKTAMQLEWAKHVAKHTGKPVLILAPLAVAEQTVAEGVKFGVDVTLCQSQGNVDSGVNVTNYEKLHKSAREDKDERHICPLQLDVIRRAIALWTNPGDVVLSPFLGIGSEGYVALQEGRKFVGIELKKSYFDQAIKNLASVEPGGKNQQISLFGGE